MRTMRPRQDESSRQWDPVAEIFRANQRLRAESEQLVRETRQLRQDATALVTARRTHAEAMARLRHAG